MDFAEFIDLNSRIAGALVSRGLPVETLQFTDSSDAVYPASLESPSHAEVVLMSGSRHVFLNKTHLNPPSPRTLAGVFVLEFAFDGRLVRFQLYPGSDGLCDLSSTAWCQPIFVPRSFNIVSFCEYLQSPLTLSTEQILGANLGNFLERHRVISPGDLTTYVCDLMGGTHGLIATITAVPDTLLGSDDRRIMLEAGASWIPLLMAAVGGPIFGTFGLPDVYLEKSTLEIFGDVGSRQVGVFDDDLAGIACEVYLRGHKELLKVVLTRTGALSATFHFFMGLHLLHAARITPEGSRRELIRKAAEFLVEPRAGQSSSEFLANLYSPAFINTNIPVVKRGQPAFSTPYSDRQMRSGELASAEGKVVSVGGRVVSVRVMKTHVFVDLMADGVIQLVLPKALFVSPDGDRPRKFDLLEVRGLVGRTTTGHLSVLVDTLSTWQPCRLEHRQAMKRLAQGVIYHAQSRMLRQLREFLNGVGFSEVITSTLQTSFHGGQALPFITWSDDQRSRLYLRGTLELSLKSALSQGLGRVYEIGSVFRNEARDKYHIPEYVLLEAYAAIGMEEAVEIVIGLCHALGCLKDPVQINHVSFADLYRRQANLDVVDLGAVANYLAKYGIRISAEDHKGIKALTSVMRHEVRRYGDGIVVVYGIAEAASPLTRIVNGFPETRLVFLNGVQIAEISGEETDLDVLVSRLNLQSQEDRHIVRRDYRPFLESIAFGLMPCVGIGVGLSRLLQHLTGAERLQDTQLGQQ